MIRRGLYLAGIITLCAPSAGAQEAMWPTTTWARSTPARQGLDAAPLEELHRGAVGAKRRAREERDKAGALGIDKEW